MIFALISPSLPFGSPTSAPGKSAVIVSALPSVGAELPRLSGRAALLVIWRQPASSRSSYGRSALTARAPTGIRAALKTEPRAELRALATNVSRQRPNRIRLTPCRVPRWIAIAPSASATAGEHVDRTMPVDLRNRKQHRQVQRCDPMSAGQNAYVNSTAKTVGWSFRLKLVRGKIGKAACRGGGWHEQRYATLKDKIIRLIQLSFAKCLPTPAEDSSATRCPYCHRSSAWCLW
jgi:hypothetical protein